MQSPLTCAAVVRAGVRPGGGFALWWKCIGHVLAECTLFPMIAVAAKERAACVSWSAQQQSPVPTALVFRAKNNTHACWLPLLIVLHISTGVRARACMLCAEQPVITTLQPMLAAAAAAVSRGLKVCARTVCCIFCLVCLQIQHLLAGDARPVGACRQHASSRSCCGEIVQSN